MSGKWDSEGNLEPERVRVFYSNGYETFLHLVLSTKTRVKDRGRRLSFDLFKDGR